MPFAILFISTLAILGAIIGFRLSLRLLSVSTFDMFVGAILGALFFMGIGLIAVYPVAGFTGGADPNYGHSVVVGRVMSSGISGTIYKTYESTIQQGDGEHAQLLNVYGRDLIPFVGQRVKLNLDIYYLPDFSKGDGTKYITGIEELSN